MWWTEFKRSPSKWFALLVALVIGAIAYARHDQWYGVWPQLSMVVQFGVALAVPLLSAAAATASLQWSRAGMDEQFGAGARNPWLRELTVLTATLVWAMLPPLGVLIVVSVISAPVASSGGPWPTFLINAVILCTLATAFGHFIAKLLPSPFSVAAAGFIAAVGLFAWGTESAWELLTLNGYPSYAISWPALTARGVLAGGLLLLALGAGAIRDWSRLRDVSPRQVWAACAGFVVVSLAAVLLVGPLQKERLWFGQTACTDTYPQVCLWPEHQRYLPVATEYVGRFNELSEFFVLPDDPYKGNDTFYEIGMRGDVGDQVSLRGGEYGIARGMISYAMIQTDFPGCAVGADAGSPELDEAYWALSDWFTAYLMGVETSAQMGVNMVGLAAIDEVLVLPREEQFAWAWEQVAVLRAPCDG